MSRNLGLGHWALPQEEELVPGLSPHLEDITEGPLRQIEAARKALHSPSLVTNRQSHSHVRVNKINTLVRMSPKLQICYLKLK